MKYLITGTGRCGTGYLAHVFSSAGVACTHEQVFGLAGPEFAKHCIELRRANPDWGWQGESSWLAAPYLAEEWLSGITVIHLVRHPELVIRSHLRMLNWNNPMYGGYQQYAYQHLPTLLDYSVSAERSAHWYIEWNKLIEPYATIRHRVEDDVCQLLIQLGIEHDPASLFNNTRYNHREIVKTDFTLQELPPQLYKAACRVAKQYGYIQ